MNQTNIKNLVKLIICVVLGIGITYVFDNIFILLISAFVFGFIMEKI